MPNAETNKARFAVGRETRNEWGKISTDAGFDAPALTYARITGETVKYNKGVVQSQEIRGDRNVVDHIEVSADVTGDIQTELTYATFDDWFYVLLSPDEAAGTGDGVSPVAATTAGYSNTAVDWSVTTTSQFTKAAAGIITGGLVAGMWIKTSGFVSPFNNGVFQIASVTTTQINVTVSTLVVVAATPSITVKGKMMRNGTGKLLGVGGTNPLSLIMEKHYSDLTTLFEHYTGIRFNQWTATMNAQQIMTMTWSVMGRTMKETTATVDSNATIVAANTNTVMNATSNLVLIVEGGVTMTVPVTALTITVKNNLANLTQIGSKFPFEQRFGWFQVEGKINAYFQDSTLRNKFINHTSTSLRIQFTDADGNGMMITIPKIRLTESSGNTIAGANQSIMTELTFAAYYDTGILGMFQLDIM